jgi:hypothetical protein
LFAHLLDLRLAIVAATDGEPGSAARLEDPVEFARTVAETAEWLDDEADNVAYWPRELWGTLETQGLADDLLGYLVTVRTYALDPTAAPLLILADQVAAALLRGLVA